MKKLVHALFVALTFATGVAAAADEAQRQLYAPIDRIYTVAEARDLSLYRRLVGEGVPAADLDQPGAFVRTYSDVAISIVGWKHVFLREVYVPPALRTDVQMGTIVAVNRYEHEKTPFGIVNEVVPRTLTEAYACVEHMGISSCTEKVVLKTKDVPKTME